VSAPPPTATSTDAPPEDGADGDADELTPPRAPVRDPRPEPAGELSEDDEDPVDPSEPCRSANATGIDTTAAPTPRATAHAPTRPTYRAHPEPDTPPPVRPTSISRTDSPPRRPPRRRLTEDDDESTLMTDPISTVCRSPAGKQRFDRIMT
jgi:hypothetical protein